MCDVNNTNNINKLVIVLSVLVAVAIVSLILVIFNLQSFQNQMLQNQQTTTAILDNQLPLEEELLLELAELQEQVRILTESSANVSYPSSITDQEAGDIAIAFIGYGDVQDTMLFVEDDTLTFEVDIRYDDGRYMVYVNAANGTVTGMRRFGDNVPADVETPDQTDETNETDQIIETIVEQPVEQPVVQEPVQQTPAAAAGSTITRDRAAEIALARQPGSLIEVDTDWERGRAVWYVAIRSGGRVHEIYVDRSTGAIVLHESDSD